MGEVPPYNYPLIRNTPRTIVEVGEKATEDPGNIQHWANEPDTDDAPYRGDAHSDSSIDVSPTDETAMGDFTCDRNRVVRINDN